VRTRALLLLALAAVMLVATASFDDPYAELRHEMVVRVQRQIRAKGITDEARDQKTLAAMEEVPRHLFVPPEFQAEAYEDRSLALGEGQTIHQPYVVALMTSLLELDRGAKVLEIGTGTGYHTAILSKLAWQVFSIEIDPKRAARARKTLEELDLGNVRVRTGDGRQGWASEAPFDAIIITAAPIETPRALIDQLRVGGKLVGPEGGFIQNLVVVTRTRDGYEKRKTIPVKLPPMSGEPLAAKP